MNPDPNIKYGKCIVRQDFECYDYNVIRHKGEIYEYYRMKVKYNTKTKRRRVVRPTQMGEWMCGVIDHNGDVLYEVMENWFQSVFQDLIEYRIERLEPLIDDK